LNLFVQLILRRFDQRTHLFVRRIRGRNEISHVLIVFFDFGIGIDFGFDASEFIDHDQSGSLVIPETFFVLLSFKFSDLRVQLREVKENHRAVAQVRPKLGRLVLIQLALSYYSLLIPYLLLSEAFSAPLVATKSFWAGSLAGGTALEGTSGLEVSFGETEVFETTLPSLDVTCLGSSLTTTGFSGAGACSFGSSGRSRG
jgi:hypothetical protein